MAETGCGLGSRHRVRKKQVRKPRAKRAPPGHGSCPRGIRGKGSRCPFLQCRRFLPGHLHVQCHGGTELGPLWAFEKRRPCHYVLHGAQFGDEAPSLPSPEGHYHVHSSALRPSGGTRSGRREACSEEEHEARRPRACIQRVRNDPARKGRQATVAQNSAAGRCGADGRGSPDRRQRSWS